MTDLCRERHLDASLQDVVSGDLHGAGQLQILHHQVGGHLREHLLDLMGLMTTRYIKSKESNREMIERKTVGKWKLKLDFLTQTGLKHTVLVIYKYKTIQNTLNLCLDIRGIFCNQPFLFNLLVR